MSGGFKNYLTTKLGRLVIGAVTSPNYAPGAAGWKIARDGTAEFNAVTVRGLVIEDATITGQVNLPNGGYISQQAAAPFAIVLGGAPVDILEPVASVLGAIEPGTVSTPEGWHSPAALPAGWTGTFRIKLMPDNTVAVHCQCAIAAAAAAGTVTVMSGLLAGYTPAHTSRGPCGYFVNGTPTAAQLAAIASMRWSANPAGTLTVQGFPGGGAGSGVTELDFTARYPLD